MAVISEIEAGLKKARISHTEFCRRAGIGTTTWGRVRAGDDLRMSTMRRIEQTYQELLTEISQGKTDTRRSSPERHQVPSVP